MLAFLCPEQELDQSSALEEMKKEAQGGMYPISRRGVSIRLSERQGKESYYSKLDLIRLFLNVLLGLMKLKYDYVLVSVILVLRLTRVWSLRI